MALQVQPDRFWAQALSAVCSLQLGQPVEAKASLNACLRREKEFAWLYNLRGYRIRPGCRDCSRPAGEATGAAGAGGNRSPVRGGRLRLPHRDGHPGSNSQR